MQGNTMPNISIVIPFYNNRSIAPYCLPGVVRLLDEHSGVNEIIAVDDCSTDGTTQWIRDTYSAITVIINEKNLGFGRSCNRGIEQSRNKWVILLNSDVKCTSDIVEPLKNDIERDPDLFAVGFYSFRESGEKFEGRKKIVPKTGLFKTRNDFGAERTDGWLYDSFYACGGHCLVSREKFLALGGFSPVFEPFYWEDVDLSYRALKRGWRVYFDPRCKVVHCHRGSIQSANSARAIMVMQTRNKMLFFWKNVSWPTLWIRHLAGMTLRVLTSWLAGDMVFYRAFGAALPRIFLIMQERHREKKFWLKTDEELFLVGKCDAQWLIINKNFGKPIIREGQ
jgi:GT2 family glycosyltransferase